MKRLYFISGIVAFLLVATGCLKEEDNIGNGPRAYLSIVNAGLGSPGIRLFTDGEAVNETAVEFGGSTGTSTNSYLKVKPGVRLMTIEAVAGQPALDKNFSFTAGKYFTLLQYDTFRVNSAYLLLTDDDLQLNDTLTNVRFTNLVAGSNALDLILIKNGDTIRVANDVDYFGMQTTVSKSFEVKFYPGTYRMELLSETGTVLSSEDVDLAVKTGYSLIAIGEREGTGERRPRMMLVAHQAF
ncbi:DUF4397 domain-containing protein [Flavihumibacter rivuli]|uniref:DUF4397 domain-containing protein n=1 Tax=Flavihumibacter rivuli TaxID=2838156 RepID=UPI001BDF5BD8|nr:DUF4397 domain-containing protein [Flavihumibacter rivuli]ULQ57966.1 DUF4397 domain-containing protein [Flavihumibacter rivuli]